MPPVDQSSENFLFGQILEKLKNIEEKLEKQDTERTTESQDTAHRLTTLETESEVRKGQILAMRWVIGAMLTALGGLAAGVAWVLDFVFSSTPKH